MTVVGTDVFIIRARHVDGYVRVSVPPVLTPDQAKRLARQLEEAA